MSTALNFAWLLYFASVSFTGVIFQVGPAAVRLEHLGLPLLALLTLKLRRSSGFAERDVKKRGTAPLIFFGVLWISMALVVTVVRAPDVSKSIWILIQISVGILCFVLVRKFDSQQKAQLVVSSTKLLTLLCAVSIAGLGLAYFAGFPTASVIGVSSDLRLVGFSFEPNIFASQIVGWLAVMFYWRLEFPSWLAASAVVMVAAVVLAGTRAAWLALIVLAVWWLLSGYEKRPLRTVFSSISILILALIVLAYWPRSGTDDSNLPLLERFLNILDTQTGTGAYRLQIYDIALSDITSSQRWLFGSGVNTFSQHNLTDPTNVGAAYLSSIWWALLYDVGVMGLVVFIALLAVASLTVRRPLAAFPAFAVLLVCASTTNLIWFVYPWMYWALLECQTRSIALRQSLDKPRSLPSAKDQPRSSPHTQRRFEFEK